MFSAGTVSARVRMSHQQFLGMKSLRISRTGVNRGTAERRGEENEARCK